MLEVNRRTHDFYKPLSMKTVYETLCECASVHSVFIK